MASQYIEIIKERTIDFSQLGQNNTVIQSLSDAIFVGDYRELALMVRVHSKTIAGGSLNFMVLNELPSRDDPAPYFVEPVASALASITVDGSNPAASPIPPSATVALKVAISTSFGSHVRVVVQAQGGGAVNLYANVSIGLNVKGM